MELENNRKMKKRTVYQGEFEKQFYLHREELATFLRQLASQLEEEKQEITISTDEWEIPFPFRDPIEVEIEFEGEEGEEKELEIELEFKSKQSDTLEVK